MVTRQQLYGGCGDRPVLMSGGGTRLAGLVSAEGSRIADALDHLSPSTSDPTTLLRRNAAAAHSLHGARSALIHARTACQDEADHLEHCASRR
jgi:hypothetical protein